MVQNLLALVGCFFAALQAVDAQECADSPTWHKLEEPAKDCAWVRGLPSKRCTVKGAQASFAFEFCRAACGTCGECGGGDTAWRAGAAGDGNNARDCFWASRLSNRCTVQDANGAYAFEGCPVACRSCGDMLTLLEPGLVDDDDDDNDDTDTGGESAVTAAPTSAPPSRRPTAVPTTRRPTFAPTRQPTEPAPLPMGGGGAYEPTTLGVLPLFPGGGLAPGEVKGWAEAERSVTTDSERLYDVSEPRLIPYLVPSAAPGSAPAAVIAPGGGYGRLTVEKEGAAVAAQLNAAGIHAFVLVYRVPERDYGPYFGWAQLIDAQRAVSLVRQDPYGIRPRAVGFVGFSAGGHLGARVATEKTRQYDFDAEGKDTPTHIPDFAVLVYPWRLKKDERDPWIWTLADVFKDAQLDDAPPIFLAHSNDDGTAPYHNSVAFYNHLAHAGSKDHHLEIHSRGGHGFGACTVPSDDDDRRTEICDWPKRVAEWLRFTVQVLG